MKPFSLPRRTALGLLTAPAVARAQAWPARPVRLVVPYPPGGPSDVVARILAESFQPRLGQPLVTDNRAGGNATIGTLAVAQAPPDGSMLLLATSHTHAINPTIMPALPYRPVEDFTPVAGIVALPHLLVVPAASPVRDVAALVALLRSAPDRHSHGSTGHGTGGHLGGAMLGRVTGGVSTHVPFRGAAPMVTELLAGRLDFAIATLPSVLAHVQRGSLRALAAASPSRLAQLPEVPTLAEAGVPGIEMDAWYAIYGPAGLPATVVEALLAVVAATFDAPETVARLHEAGFIMWRRSAAELAVLLPGEMQRWGELVRTAGARVE